MDSCNNTQQVKQKCAGSCKGYRLPLEFIGKNGKIMKTCEKCRIKNSKVYIDNKEKIKERSNLYYANNTEKVKERIKQYYNTNIESVKKYRKNNSENIKAVMKKWRANNSDHIKQYNIRTLDRRRIIFIRYYNTNKEAIKKYNKQWADKNREHIKERNKKYEIKNAEAIKERYKKYRNKPTNKLNKYKRSASDRGIFWDDSMTESLCIELFMSICYYCGVKSEHTLNGIDRMDSQKPYEASNCVSCCKICNFAKGCLDPYTFLKRCSQISKHHGGIGEYSQSIWSNSKSDPYERQIKTAVKSNKEFALTIEQFKVLINGECYYCGKKNSTKHLNGIDRKDSKIGYIIDNCVTCCGDCNFMKNVVLDTVFIEHCKKISSFCTDIQIDEKIPRCNKRFLKKSK
jgi:hypothetical protein